MGSKPPPLICEKCHRVRLHPVKDKGHRWCKKCRTLEFAKAAGLPSDEQRKLRAGYEYTGCAALLLELNSIKVIKRDYEKGCYYQIKRVKRNFKKR